MDDEEIGALNAAFKLSKVFYQPDPDRAPLRVTRLGHGAKIERTDAEPGQCAWFTDGDCVGLRDVLLSAFMMSSPITVDAPKHADREDLLHLSFERFWQSRRSFKPGDLHKLPIDRSSGDGGEGIEYSQDHVQRHWWTFQNAVRLHGRAPTMTYDEWEKAEKISPWSPEASAAARAWSAALGITDYGDGSYESFLKSPGGKHANG